MFCSLLCLFAHTYLILHYHTTFTPLLRHLLVSDNMPHYHAYITSTPLLLYSTYLVWCHDAGFLPLFPRAAPVPHATCHRAYRRHHHACPAAISACTPPFSFLHTWTYTPVPVLRGARLPVHAVPNANTHHNLFAHMHARLTPACTTTTCRFTGSGFCVFLRFYTISPFHHHLPFTCTHTHTFHYRTAFCLLLHIVLHAFVLCYIRLLLYLLCRFTRFFYAGYLPARHCYTFSYKPPHLFLFGFCSAVPHSRSYGTWTTNLVTARFYTHLLFSTLYLHSSFYACCWLVYALLLTIFVILLPRTRCYYAPSHHLRLATVVAPLHLSTALYTRFSFTVYLRTLLLRSFVPDYFAVPPTLCLRHHFSIAGFCFLRFLTHMIVLMRARTLRFLLPFSGLRSFAVHAPHLRSAYRTATHAGHRPTCCLLDTHHLPPGSTHRCCAAHRRFCSLV